MVISRKDREVLVRWALARVKPGDRFYKRAVRARIVLFMDASYPAGFIANYMQVSAQTAEMWWARYVDEGLSGLSDRPRRGAPRRITDERVEELIRQLSAPTPVGARPWSCRSLAEATGLSRSSVNRIWRKWKAGLSGAEAPR